MTEFPRAISIYNAILNYVQERGLRDFDDFSWKLTSRIIRSFANNEFNTQTIINKIPTSFFKLNSIKRSDFYSTGLEAVILRKWKERTILKYPLQGKEKEAVKHLVNIQKEVGKFERIYIEDIDSFEKVRDITNEEASKFVPLRLKEYKIKEHLADIIGEKFVQKDWGGETRDLYTSRIRLGRKRISAAFLLKGSGTKGKLTISKCGKNGDQILRLIKTSGVRLFFVQHIDQIDPSVVETLESHVAYESRKGKKLYYCVIDGIDTARILLAYKKPIN